MFGLLPSQLITLPNQAIAPFMMKSMRFLPSLLLMLFTKVIIFGTHLVFRFA
ncbi:hypothetical protein RHMOL_Rhmol04G0183600 [Rhododendron molle]|uniref:Uncharacterized protein n=1 Tax=Rhododendron molle TaxID=49168 RepID=A0ACC0P488_RHOML|nr:hypothetical protein RHMOL_Rhmol04G0183600 [Rhododendron molle]